MQWTVFGCKPNNDYSFLRGKMNWNVILNHLDKATEASVLVCVSRVKGSAPREAGTAMLVTESQCIGTIGGGRLEYKAIEIAHETLDNVAHSAVEGHARSFPLGAGLGQCCGGLVELYFEVVFPGSLWVKPLIKKLKNDGEAVLHLPINADNRNKKLQAGVDIPLNNNEFHLVIFGAGHVARALVNFLLPLPCSITWVDERDEMWTPESLSSLPIPLPEKINPVCCDSPEAEVAHAPVNSYFLVMTHNHSLDQKLCELILKRNDFHHLGMIGSRSKRLTFEKRLVQRGINQQQLARMICPIGLPGIIGKAPEIVALSVAAELMQIHSQSINQSISGNKSSNG